jgi:uncharacterized protein (DUF2384 family)
VSNFQHKGCIVGHPYEQVWQQRADKVHAVHAAITVAVQSECRLCQKFSWQRRHAVCVHVGRVAQNQLERAARMQRGCSKAIGFDQLHTLLHGVLRQVDMGHGQRVP